MGACMIKCYVVKDESGRIVAWTEAPQGDTFEETEMPDTVTQYNATGWVYADGEWRYDPLPEPDPQPTLEERVTTIEGEMNALTSAFEVSE